MFSFYHITGSSKQRQELLELYEKFHGDLDNILETYITQDLNCEDEVRKTIQEAIDSGEVEAYAEFTDEPPKKRAKRVKRVSFSCFY